MSRRESKGFGEDSLDLAVKGSFDERAEECLYKRVKGRLYTSSLAYELYGLRRGQFRGALEGVSIDESKTALFGKSERALIGLSKGGLIGESKREP